MFDSGLNIDRRRRKESLESAFPAMINFDQSRFNPRDPSFSEKGTGLKLEASPAGCGPFSKAQQAQALASAIESIRTLHHQTFPAVQRLVVPRPTRPDHAAILQRRMNDALARVSIFRRSTRNAAKAAAVLATRMECDEVGAASQAQHVAVQQEIDKLWQRLITNDADVVLAVLSHAFQNSGAHAAPLAVWDAEVQLALLPPGLAALPERHPTTTAAGNLSLKKFTKGEIAALYEQLVAGLVLITAKQAFAVAPAANDLRIVALRSTPADAYGTVGLTQSGCLNCSTGAQRGAVD